MWAAENAAADPTNTVLAVVSLIVAGASTALTMLFAHLSSRDKLRYDARILVLEQEVETCKKERVNDLTVHAELRTEIKDLRNRLYGPKS